MFTPVGSPSAAEQDDRIETSTPPTSKLKQRATAGSETTPPTKPQRQPLAPMSRQPQLTAVAGAQQDAAAQALLSLLADSAAEIQADLSRVRNRHESLWQARMATTACGSASGWSCCARSSATTLSTRKLFSPPREYLLSTRKCFGWWRQYRVQFCKCTAPARSPM